METRLSVKHHVYMLILIVTLFFIGIAYAVLQRTLSIEGTANVGKNSWDVHFDNVSVSPGSVTAITPATIDSSGTMISFAVNLVKPGDYYEFFVDVVNDGTINAVVSSVNVSELTQEQKNFLCFYATYEDGVLIESGQSLAVDETEKIRVVVLYKEEASKMSLQTINFSVSITYSQDDGSGETRLSNSVYSLLKNDAVNDQGVVNLGQTSVANNTNGKYMLNTTANKANPIYYYRGAVDNNVIFNNFCWKMIRTTETGGVKLIYNGVPTDGKCENTGINTFIEDDTADPKKYTGKHRWSDNHTSPDDVIYRTSEMKTVLESWYADHMTNVTSKLEDTPFHNETTYTTGGTGIKGYFPAGYRIWKEFTNYQSDVPNTTIVLGNSVYGDEFTYTTGTTNTNNKLTYPVGLIESDEVVLAGGRGWISDSDNGANNQYYLYTGNWYWTFSPSSVGSNSVAYMVYVNGSGGIGSSGVGNADGGVRPVVSLKVGATYLDNGADGSVNKPYVIS